MAALANRSVKLLTTGNRASLICQSLDLFSAGLLRPGSSDTRLDKNRQKSDRSNRFYGPLPPPHCVPQVKHTPSSVSLSNTHNVRCRSLCNATCIRCKISVSTGHSFLHGDCLTCIFFIWSDVQQQDIECFCTAVVGERRQKMRMKSRRLSPFLRFQICEYG